MTYSPKHDRVACRSWWVSCSLISFAESKLSYHLTCRSFSHDTIEVSHHSAFQFTSSFLMQYTTDLFVHFFKSSHHYPLLACKFSLSKYQVILHLSSQKSIYHYIVFHLCPMFKNFLAQNFWKNLFSHNSGWVEHWLISRHYFAFLGHHISLKPVTLNSHLSFSNARFSNLPVFVTFLVDGSFWSSPEQVATQICQNAGLRPVSNAGEWSRDRWMQVCDFAFTQQRWITSNLLLLIKWWLLRWIIIMVIFFIF